MHRATLVAVTLIAAAIGLSAPAHGGTDTARNGKIVFQASVGKYKQLFTVNANGTGLKQVTHISFSGDSEGAEQADWSPDGSTIAFDGPSGNRVNIFTIRPDGTGLAELPLTVTGFNGAPAYSPDGTKIAFDQDAGPAEPTVHGIFVANADGSNPRRVTTGIRTANAYDTNADWSPDGSRLSFTRVKNSKQAAIYVVKMNGEGLKRLTPWKLDAALASWAPDGSKLVFESYNDAQAGKSSNLFTISPNGGAMTRLTRFSGGATQALGPAWSPDGKKIVWHKVSPQLNQLFVIDSRGASQRQLTHMRGDANPGHADWGTAG
jgi:Tol biopolymer transport system component